MKLRFAAALIAGLCLVTSATGQQQPVAPTAPPPTIKGPCPDTPESKTAWFDPNLYLLHSNNGVKLGRPSIST